VDAIPARADRDRCPFCGARLGRGRGSALADPVLARRLATFAVIGMALMLAAPAAYRRVQRASYRGETLAQLEAIRAAERTYRDEWGELLAAAPTPDKVPSADTEPFVGPGAGAFGQLGWAPATVRCRYRVTLEAGTGSLASEDFVVTAECDLDGDGEYAVYEASRDRKAHRVGPGDVW